MSQVAFLAAHGLLALTGSLVCCLPLAAAAPIDPAAWKVEQRRASFVVAATAKVQVKNPLGNVTVRAGEAGEVVVTSIIQHHREDLGVPELKVTTVADGSSLELAVVVPPTTGASRPEWAGRRVDLGVVVPDHAVVSVRTDAGEVEVEGLAGRADLETAAGAIRFRGRGGLSARSHGGSVFAQLRASGWPDPIEITTVTGDIRVQLLEGATATVELETRGPITSDYSTTIERRPGQLLKTGRALVGAAGQVVRLRSHSGALRLDAVIVPEAAVGGGE